MATNMNRTSASTSRCMSAKPFPFRVMPRTMRRKWVSGNASLIYCAQSGMPRNGNMKPDSRILGKKKKVIWP